MTSARRLLWLGAALTAAPLSIAPAHAQIAADAEVESDERFRGVSLSDGAPAMSFSLSYDHASGAYGGFSVTAGDFGRGGAQALGLVTYVGYARRLRQGGAWDVGVTETGETIRLDRRYSSNYAEIYAGFTRRNISIHLYYSPKYVFEGVSTLYIEADSAAHLANHWRLFGHAGVLTPLDSVDTSHAGATSFDLRVGIARELGRSELNVAWTATSPAPIYPEGYRQAPNALVAALLYFF